MSQSNVLFSMADELEKIAGLPRHLKDLIKSKGIKGAIAQVKDPAIKQRLKRYASGKPGGESRGWVLGGRSDAATNEAIARQVEALRKSPLPQNKDLYKREMAKRDQRRYSPVFRSKRVELGGTGYPNPPKRKLSPKERDRLLRRRTKQKAMDAWNRRRRKRYHSEWAAEASPQKKDIPKGKAPKDNSVRNKGIAIAAGIGALSVGSRMAYNRYKAKTKKREAERGNK